MRGPGLLLPSLLLLVLGGCSGAPESGGDTDGTPGSSSGPPGATGATSGAPGCECFVQQWGANGWACEPGIECGDYVEHVDGTGEPCSDDPTGTTGDDPTGTGDGGSSECELELAANAMVVECVLAAAAAGDATHFRHLNNPGNIEADYDDYWVRPGQPLAVRREEFRDLCDDFFDELRADPSFDACMGLPPEQAWACIQQQLSTEPTADCGMWGGCEGT